MDMTMNPFENVERITCSQEEYFEIDAYSSTDLRTLLKERMNPYLVRERKKNGWSGTDATDMGSLIDCMLTEPQMVRERYIEEPAFSSIPTTDAQKEFAQLVLSGVDKYDAHASTYKRTSNALADALYDELNPWMAFQRLSGGQKTIPASMWALSKATAVSVMNHKRWPDLKRAEKQAVFVGEAFGVKWKAMLDFMDPNVITDLKTTADWLRIKHNFFSRGYNVQLRHYSWMAGVDAQQVMYAETVAPHRTKLVHVTDYVNDASELTLDLMARIAHADSTGDWMHTMEYTTNNGYETL